LTHFQTIFDRSNLQSFLLQWNGYGRPNQILFPIALVLGRYGNVKVVGFACIESVMGWCWVCYSGSRNLTPQWQTDASNQRTAKVGCIRTYSLFNNQILPTSDRENFDCSSPISAQAFFWRYGNNN